MFKWRRKTLAEAAQVVLDGANLTMGFSDEKLQELRAQISKRLTNKTSDPQLVLRLIATDVCNACQQQGVEDENLWSRPKEDEWDVRLTRKQVGDLAFLTNYGFGRII